MKFTSLLKSVILEQSKFEVLLNALTKPSVDKEGKKMKPKLSKEEFYELMQADPTTKLNNVDLENSNPEELKKVKAGKFTAWIIKNYLTPKTERQPGDRGYEEEVKQAKLTYIEDLSKISKICKENNIKSYLTLNTVVFDHDISLMKRIVDAAKANGISAIIATDLSVLNYAKKVQMNVHISTQSNITNIDTVEFFSVYSDVMVLARELSLTQVGEITNEIKKRNITGPSGQLVKIEIFGHGALCMAVSGKCYLSLHSNYASANRGACIQNCRKSYLVIDKEDGVELEIDNEYIMSAKDLCTIDFMDQIIQSGVAVLKIEGRGRSADYVSTVTKCYREAIDSCYNNSFTNEKIVAWRNQLSTVYNRGFWDGYYLGKTMGEWSNEYGSKATKRKVMIGISHKEKDKLKVLMKRY